MTLEEQNNKIVALEKQVKEMQDYILGMTGNLNFKNQVGKFAKEAVIQQVATVDDSNPDSEIVNTITIGVDGGTADTMDFPDYFVFLRDKDNNIYKVPAYNVTL